MIIGNRDVTNPLEVIECIVAFDCKDYSARPRDRMLYAIVFGWDDEEETRFGWDNETINEYKELHKRFEELSRIDRQPHVGGWIPVTERLPKVEEEVFVQMCRNGHIIATTAIYEDGKMSTEDSIWNWYDLEFDYDEENDVYLIPEGWWEYRHYNPDDIYNNIIDDIVVAWQPLPEPFKEEEDV